MPQFGHGCRVWLHATARPFRKHHAMSFPATIEEGLVTSLQALPGNSYDSHTLAEALEEAEILTDQRPALAIVHRGYGLVMRVQRSVSLP